MKCTLFIPAYNEAPVIIPTLVLLRDMFRQHPDVAWHITVIDNASTDGMGEAVRSLADPAIDLLTLPEKGKGFAVRSGYAALYEHGTSNDVVGFTDADLSVPPEEIMSAMRTVARGESDVVIGSRLSPKKAMPGREWWRVGSSEIFNILAHCIVGTKASDAQCPLKVMNDNGAKVMRTTEECTWFLDLEFLTLCERSQLRIIEVPVSWVEHRYPLRQSKLSTLTDGIRAIFAMFRIRRRRTRQLSFLGEKR